MIALRQEQFLVVKKWIHYIFHLILCFWVAVFHVLLLNLVINCSLYYIWQPNLEDCYFGIEKYMAYLLCLVCEYSRYVSKYLLELGHISSYRGATKPELFFKLKVLELVFITTSYYIILQESIFRWRIDFEVIHLLYAKKCTRYTDNFLWKISTTPYRITNLLSRDFFSCDEDQQSVTH